MPVVYVLGILLVFGLAQAETIPQGSPAFIEDIRSAGDSRIVAGWEAYDGQISHQISIRMVNSIGDVSGCGGSVIHHNWIITAAHCLANRITFVVRMGLTHLERPELILESTLKYIHPRYDEVKAGVQTDDIALLGLDYHVNYSPLIQPCRLQNSGQKNVDYTGTLLTVSGFGRTDDSWNGGVLSDKLFWVHQIGISNADCLIWYPGDTVQAQTLCTAYYNNTSQSSCQGDSGGPLTVLDADDKPTLVGIVSFGSNRGCNSVFPAAFVRPGHYHDWYLEVTGVNFDWDSSDIAPPTGGGNGDGDGNDDSDGDGDERYVSSESKESEESDARRVQVIDA